MSIEKIETILGCHLGQQGEPVSFLNSVTGILPTKPSRSWIHRVRTGKTKGGGLLQALNLALAEGSSKKDNLYREIASEAVRIRIYGTGQYSNRYLSDHYTEEVAEGLIFHLKDVQRCIRAMRIDLVYGDRMNVVFTQFFIGVASKYFHDNVESVPPSKRGVAVVKLSEIWDYRSPTTFYRNMYELMRESTRSIGGWVPYEMEAMKCFYDERIRSNASPTDFDDKVLRLRKDTDFRDLITEIGQNTGIPVDSNVLFNHRNALVYGNPDTGIF